MVGDILDAMNVPMKPGNTVIVVWDDLKHYTEWSRHNRAQSNDVRILTLNTSELPLKLEHNATTICVAGAGFSKRPDYSDLVIHRYKEFVP